jgi:hypothetical protein
MQSAHIWYAHAERGPQLFPLTSAGRCPKFWTAFDTVNIFLFQLDFPKKKNSQWSEYVVVVVFFRLIISFLSFSFQFEIKLTSNRATFSHEPIRLSQQKINHQFILFGPPFLG